VFRDSGIQVQLQQHHHRPSWRTTVGAVGGTHKGVQEAPWAAGRGGVQGFRYTGAAPAPAPPPPQLAPTVGAVGGRQGVCVQGFRHTGAAAAPPPPAQVARDGRRSGRHVQGCSGIQAYRCSCSSTTTAPAGA